MQYERHRREYTLLGITSVMEAFFSHWFKDIYGANFIDMPYVIDHGVFYHYQVEGDRQNVSRIFLEKINRGEINYIAWYEPWEKIVEDYFKFIVQPEASFTKQTILEFYKYYCDIIKVAYACMDTLDVIETLKPELRADFTAFAERVRLRAEPIYKRGEMEFIPRYANWFSQNILSGYTGEEITFITAPEMKEYILNGVMVPEAEELRARKDFCYARQWPFENIEVYSSEEGRKKMKEKNLNLPVDNSKLREVKGTVAFKGVVQGKVRLVQSRAEMANFLDNEIIVTSMTDPSYLPIMKRASAFVTDEGGMLCHAAIVARELKKPCIIGTKIATEVFKDGDMVVVDANSGVVKKI